MEKKEVKKVCVTGAARYLGSYLVKKLMERGYTVHADDGKGAGRFELQVVATFRASIE
ncbi:hypothetical protein LguiA_001186 [Lonicera macranthoides]